MQSRRLLIHVVIAGIILACFVLSASAQDLSLDYQMTVGGRAASAEKSTVVHEGGRITYTSSMSMTYPQPVAMTSRLVLNETTRRPVAYHMEAQAGGGAQKLDLTFSDESVEYRAEHPSGSQTGSLRLHPGFVVWENNVWGMLTYSLEQVDWEKQTQGNLYVLIPTTMRQFVMRFESKGLEDVSIGGVLQPSRRLTLTLGDSLAMEVWMDPATRSPLKIRIPAQQVEIVRNSPANPTPVQAGGSGAGN